MLKIIDVLEAIELSALSQAGTQQVKRLSLFSSILSDNVCFRINYLFAISCLTMPTWQILFACLDKKKISFTLRNWLKTLVRRTDKLLQVTV